MSFDVIGPGFSKTHRSKTSGHGFVSPSSLRKGLAAVFFGCLVLLGTGIIAVASSEGNTSGTSRLASRPSGSGTGSGTRVLGINTARDGLFTFNIPTLFKSLLTAAVIQVNGDASIGGDLSVSGETTLGEMLVTGKVQLQDDVTGENIDLDIGTGELTASNVVYSVAAGSGISVSGTQDLTITNTDRGSDQKMFRTITVGSDSFSAGSNSDTFTIAGSGGITVSGNTADKKLTISADTGTLNVSGFSDDGTNVHLTTSTDKLGIGTSAPSTKLHVVGSTTIEGTLLVTDISMLHGIDVQGDGITNAGSITGASGITSSGTITFSGLSTGVVKSSLAGVLSSSAVNLASADVTGTLPTTSGGTGVTSYTTGDLLYGSATNTLSTLGIGGDGEVLTVASGIPTWGTISGSVICPTCLLSNPGSTQTITPTSATATGLSVRQASGGSVDIFSVTNTTGSSSFLRVDSSGNVILGAGGTSSFGNFTVNPTGTDPIALLPTSQGAGAFTGTITSEDLTATRTWTLPDASGTMCLTTGNCAGVGGNFGGTGTTNYLAKFNTATTVGNSILYDDGTQIGINDSTPSYVLDVNGTGRFVGALTAGSTLGVTGNTTLGGTLQTTGATSLLSTLDVTGATTLSSTLGVTSNTTIGGTLGVTGNATFDTNTLYVDAVNHRVGVGTTSPGEKFVISGGNELINTGADGNISLAQATDDTNMNLISLNSSKTLAGAMGMYARASVDNRLWVQGRGNLFLLSKPSGGSTLNIGVTDISASLVNNGNFTIAGGGLGVGTVTPVEKTHIVGNLRFGSAPATLTTLNGAVDISQTTITVVSTTSYPSAGTLLIDSEAMTYTGTTATTFTGVTRGVLGTTAATHNSGTSVNNYLMTSIATATTPRMVVTGNGNVGIGTSTPSSLLHVAGNALFTGNITSPGSGVGSEKFGAFASVGSTINSVALGNNATVTGDYGVALGYNTNASRLAVAIGLSAVTGSGDNRSVAIGFGANASGGGSVAMGPGALSSGGNSVAMLGSSTGTNNIAILGNAGGSQYSISLGGTGSARSILIGAQSVDNGFSGIGIGQAAALTANGQLVFNSGFGEGPLSSVWFGNPGGGLGSNVSLNVRGVSGTDVAGNNLTFNGGQSTGAGLGGNLIFATSPVGTSGSSTNALVERIRVTSAGLVGIGTVSPKEKLEIAGNLRLGSAPANLTTLNGAVDISQTTIPVVSTTSYPTAGTLLIESEAMTYTGTTATTFTGVTRGVLGTTAATHTSGTSVNNYLMTSIATATTPRMVVMGGGNVGIGTTSPTVKLHIAGTGAGAAMLVDQLTPGSAGNNAQIETGLSGVIYSWFGTAGSTDGLINGAVQGDTAFRSLNKNILFSTDNGTTANLYIKNGGNVGIGTTTPSAKLTISAPAGNREELLRFDVTDATSRFDISNATSTGGVFAPNFQGYQTDSSSLSALYFTGMIDVANDTGTAPVTTFSSRVLSTGDPINGGFATVTNRPLFAWRNSADIKMLMDASGNLGLGTTAPAAALDVQRGITAASGVAYGMRGLQTLTAAANNDVLTGLFINPTYANGAFTGVTNQAALIVTGDAAAKGLVVKAAASQTANLQEWQNSSGTALSIMDKNGNLGVGGAPDSAYGKLHVRSGNIVLDNSSGIIFGYGSGAGPRITGGTTLTLGGSAASGIILGTTDILSFNSLTWSSTASVEQTKIKVNNDSYKLTEGVALTNWRSSQFLAPTIRGTNGGVTESVTNAATLYVNAAPITGVDATITNSYSLWVDAGDARFDGNVGIGATGFGTGAAGVFAIAGSTAPTTGITDGIQLWAEDVAGSHELRVMDEAGNITTLSPHNFSLIPEGRSEDLAWGFYSQRGALAINADMTKALRIVEKLSGEQLIYIKDMKTGQDIAPTFTQPLETTPPTTSELLASGSIPGIAQWSYNAWHFVGEMIVDGVATFKNTVKFEKAVEFADSVIFKKRVEFADEDMAGTVLMKKGDTVATVTFTQPFAGTPAVTLTPQDTFVLTKVNKVTTTGFEVEISQAQGQEVTITWIALPVKRLPQTESGAVPSPSPELSTPAVSPMPASPVPTPAPTVTPVASDSAEASISATPAPATPSAQAAE